MGFSTVSISSHDFPEFTGVHSEFPVGAGKGGGGLLGVFVGHFPWRVVNCWGRLLTRVWHIVSEPRGLARNQMTDCAAGLTRERGQSHTAECALTAACRFIVSVSGTKPCRHCMTIVCILQVKHSCSNSGILLLCGFHKGKLFYWKTTSDATHTLLWRS